MEFSIVLSLFFLKASLSIRKYIDELILDQAVSILFMSRDVYDPCFWPETDRFVWHCDNRTLSIQKIVQNWHIVIEESSMKTITKRKNIAYHRTRCAQEYAGK